VNVPLLDLTAQYRPLRDEILAAITRVADSQRFIMGPEVEGLEREMAAMLEVEHAIGLSSGTDALLAALMALGIGPGDDVVTSGYTFFATGGCITRLGARPIFVDINPSTFNLDPDQLAAAITSATRAIIPVHLFGLVADMDPIVAIASERRVPIIEDAAQAIGARYRGKQAGSFGAISCFSFFPSKNLGAFGDAGLATTNDASLARELRLLRNHGMEPKYVHAKAGGNFRLDALQAAVLRVKAPHLAAWSAARRRNADRYRELFANAGVEDVTLPVEPPNHTHIYNQFVIRTQERDDLRTHLQSNQVGTEIYYPIPLHRQRCFAPNDFRLPHADAAAATSLALPIYGELTLDQQHHVVHSIAEFCRSGAKRPRREA
jgi:dTDP-4-amino-4,6-dideoxygalactose transaminase